MEHPDGLVLVDSGLGNKDDPKFRNIYGIENAGAPGRRSSRMRSAEAGTRPGDVRWVINTHLHFDHAGGNTCGASRGAEHADQADGFAPIGHADAAVLRARLSQRHLLVQRGDLEFARHTNERTRASYLPPNFEPVAAAGKFRLLEGDGEVLPGISVRVTPGHVPCHQSVLVSDGGETMAFVGDLIPTSAHLPLP